jgi:hypothetical protein
VGREVNALVKKIDWQSTSKLKTTITYQIDGSNFLPKEEVYKKGDETQNL